MKKILLFIQLFIAVCLTACYTNVITDYEGEGDGGGGGNPSNQFITLSDPTQSDSLCRLSLLRDHFYHHLFVGELYPKR